MSISYSKFSALPLSLTYPSGSKEYQVSQYLSPRSPIDSLFVEDGTLFNYSETPECMASLAPIDFPSILGHSKNSGNSGSNLIIYLSFPSIGDISNLQSKFAVVFGSYQSQYCQIQTSANSSEYFISVAVPEHSETASSSPRVPVYLVIYDSQSPKSVNSLFVCDFLYEQDQQPQLKSPSHYPSSRDKSSSSTPFRNASTSSSIASPALSYTTAPIYGAVTPMTSSSDLPTPQQKITSDSSSSAPASVVSWSTTADSRRFSSNMSNPPELSGSSSSKPDSSILPTSAPISFSTVTPAVDSDSNLPPFSHLGSSGSQAIKSEDVHIKQQHTYASSHQQSPSISSSSSSGPHPLSQAGSSSSTTTAAPYYDSRQMQIHQQNAVAVTQASAAAAVTQASASFYPYPTANYIGDSYYEPQVSQISQMSQMSQMSQVPQESWVNFHNQPNPPRTPQNIYMGNNNDPLYAGSWQPRSSAYPVANNTRGGNYGMVSTLDGSSSNPQLVRTTALSQAVSSLGSGNAGLVGLNNALNGEILTEPFRASLEILGNMESLTQGWSITEWQARRRLVQFRRVQRGSVISVQFLPLDQDMYSPNIPCISCIHWEERGECFVTSVDCIYLLEKLVNTKFTVEEKNRIRRNLEGYHPLTVSKGRANSGEFFKLIMSFSAPKPRNIEKDVKVFPWKVISLALKKIISKYSADYGNTGIYGPNAAVAAASSGFSNLRPMIPQPPSLPPHHLQQQHNLSNQNPGQIPGQIPPPLQYGQLHAHTQSDRSPPGRQP